MSSVPLAALGIRPVQQEDPTEPIRQMVALKSLLQNQQLQQLNLQKGQMELTQEKNLQGLFQKSAQTGQEPSVNDVMAASPTMGAKILLDRMNMLKAKTDITKSQGEIENQGLDYLGSMARGVLKDAKNADGTWDTGKIQSILDTAQGTPFQDKVAQMSPQVMQMAKGDPQKFADYLTSLVARSPKWSQVTAEETRAEAAKMMAGKPTTGTLLSMPLGPAAEQMNAAMTRRWQVMHPNEPLPKDFQLTPQSTYFQFQNVDKVLNGEEAASLTKETRDQNFQLRQMMYQLAAQRKQEYMNTQGSQMVAATDPKTGKQIFGPQADMLAHGLTAKDFVKMPQGLEATKPLSAQQWLQLADSQDPNNPGILQLINRIKARGHLGILASRWNDFMAGKIGAAQDPDFAALRSKLDLSNTLLANVHVGNRGGWYLLERFDNLANQGKMNAKTLLNGFKGEYEYVEDRAGVPSWRPQPRPSSIFEAPGPGDSKFHYTGKKGDIYSDDGKTWYDGQGNEITSASKQ